MKHAIILLTAIIMFGQSSGQLVQNINFKDYFENKTMRVDYFHSGTATEEHFAIDRILNDGPWSGSKTQLIDKLNFGLYFFVLLDLTTGKPLYNRGFASIFGEWQTIPEAKDGWGTFHESIRFPWPLKPVKLIVKKRDSENNFVKIWETEIDPSSRIVNPAENLKKHNVFNFMENGPASEKVDIVILGDGYTDAKMEKFHQDVIRMTNELFAVEPFKSRKNDFNVRAIDTPV